jgi:MSHA biogenesis protein MshG
MPRFAYRARDRRGEALTGSIEADSADAVAEQLFNNDITPIDIQPEREPRESPLAQLQKRLARRSLRDDDLVLLCRELYTLSRAGVPIIRALRGLAAGADNPLLVEVLEKLVSDLESGLDLATAVKQRPEVFPPLFISLVRVGETTGRLDESFLQLANYLDEDRENRARIKSAMRYPLVVCGAMLMAIVIINIFVIPAFSGVFARLGADLPLATRILVTSSNFTVQWWPALLAASIAGWLGLRSWLRTSAGRYQWHRWRLRIPVVGSVIYRATLGRFVRALGLSLNAGVPLLQAITVAAGALDNDYLEAHMLDMRSGIEHGESLSRTAAATGLFTPLVLQMLAVGEETGAVEELLHETADHYEREVRYALKTLSDSIEPILISALGGLVLLLALGVFLPMWDLAGAARGG